MKNKFLTESQISDIIESNKNDPEWFKVYGECTPIPRKEQERYSDKTKENYRSFVSELCTNAIIEEISSIKNTNSDFYFILSEELESRK